MENIVANPSWNKTVQVNDPKLRMPTRPIPNAQAESCKIHQSSKQPRRRGKAVEDLGTTFAQSSSEGKKKPTSTLTRRQDASDHDPNSDDELDMFSSHHGSDMEASVVKEVEKDPPTGSSGINLAKLKRSADVLKTLKFTKTKRYEDDGQAGSSSSQPIVLKENGNKDASSNGKSSPPSRPVYMGQSTVRRARSPHYASSKRSPSPNRRRSQYQAPNASRENGTSENSRPKPRPVRARKGSVQQSAQAFPEVHSLQDKHPASPARRMTVSGPQPFPSIGLSPSQSSKSLDLAKQPAPQTLKKPKPAGFPPLSPPHSPLRPSEFPSLEPLVGKKVAGKRSVSEKVAKPKPADFLIPPPSKKGGMAKVKNKQGSKRVVISSDESDGHESEASISRKAQPFPMSAQVLDSIGSSSIARPSSLGKRSPSGSDDRRKNKKRKDADSDIQVVANPEYEEDDTLTVSPHVDPRTLCPYCDTPLPPSPTALLKRLLASTEKRSRREPRPDNPLGRNAPFTAFIAVCQRHRFESEILPQAERRGWPKVIDWIELGKRVHRMKGKLRAIIDDRGGTDGDDDYEGQFGNEGNSRPRAQCVFWKEVIAEVKQKGSRAVAGVRGQFASFEKMQPGYYGELGSVIIHQTLYDLFPPTSIDPGSVAPLTPNEFVQRILVPEVGVQLIMEDMGLDGSNVEEAARILRESANYGVAMFPVDEGEEDEGVRKGAKLGVADSIVMERAKKRRKELEVDEQDKKEQIEIEEKQAEKPRRVSRKVGKRGSKNAKEKESDVEPPAQAPPARPRPRPVGKSSTMASVRNTDVEMTAEVPCVGEGDTDVEVEQAFNSHSNYQHSRNANDLLAAHSHATLRKTKVVKPPADTDIDLCTTSSDSDGQWDLGRMTSGRKPLAKPRSVAVTQDDLEPPPSSRTSSAYYSSVVHSDSEEATPKPSSRLRRASPEVPPPGQTLPLLRAKERKARSSRLTAEESHSWLLSDTTHSSLESITYK